MLEDWYRNRMYIYKDCYFDLRYILVLREHSDPAETLKIIKERLDQTKKELIDDKENS